MTQTKAPVTRQSLLMLFLCYLLLSSNHLFAQRNAVLKAKTNLISLRSDLLTVNIDRLTGLPYNYFFKKSGIWGVDSTHKLKATLCELNPRHYFDVELSPVHIDATETHANVTFKAFYQNKPAASFHVIYTLEGNAGLIITMQNVEEYDGFQLIEASLPDLVTVREEDGDGWLAHSMNGGEVVDLKNAIPNQVPSDGNFGDIGYVLPVAVVGTNKIACVMEVSAFMDGTKVAITGKRGTRHAQIGTIQVYRVHGGRAYDMNDGGDAIRGNAQTLNLLVGQRSRCRLDFTGDTNGNGTVDWLDGAMLIAARMPSTPTKYFDNKFIYLIAGRNKVADQPRTTFEQSEKLVRDIAERTDYAPQLALVSGWVYDGQDTGFPSEDKVNESLGGYDKLMKLIADSRKYNATVSLNVNYDDAYKSSPIFDTAFIARRPDGKIWRSRAWDGEDSYIVGMAKFMKKWGEARMDYTVKRYKIHDAILIDAMSWFAIRNDWDSSNPASGYKNLVEGKYKIIDGFKKRGIAVMSEQLRYPFIGKLAISADGFGGGASFFGGEPIPFLATIYRKSAIWGTGDFSRSDTQNSLFWNCRSIQWYDNATDRNDIVDYYFMTVLPFSKIHDKAVVGYRRRGFTTEIRLENHSSIVNDWMKKSYSIIVNGIPIAGDNATFCPVDSNKIAFFSRESKELSAKLPFGWRPEMLAARALFPGRRERVKVEVHNGMIILNVTAGTPVIVYRTNKLADSLH